MATLPSLPPLTGDTSWIDNPTGMQGLPTPITSVRPLSSTGTAVTTDPNASGIAAARGIDTSNAAQYAASPIGGYHNTVTDWIQANLERGVFIVVGMILISAAVLSFAFTAAEKGTSQGVSLVRRGKGIASRAAEIAGAIP